MADTLPKTLRERIAAAGGIAAATAASYRHTASGHSRVGIRLSDSTSSRQHPLVNEKR